MSTESEMSLEASIESVTLIMRELRHVRDKFRELNQVERYNAPWRRFVKPSDRDWFRVQKQRYKNLLDKARLWLKNHGKNPRARVDYDKGFYGPNGNYVDDEIGDTPVNWQVQAQSVHDELEDVYFELRYGPPAQQGPAAAASTGAQNAYLINWFS